MSKPLDSQWRSFSIWAMNVGLASAYGEKSGVLRVSPSSQPEIVLSVRANAKRFDRAMKHLMLNYGLDQIGVWQAFWQQLIEAAETNKYRSKNLVLRKFGGIDHDFRFRIQRGLKRLKLPKAKPGSIRTWN